MPAGKMYNYTAQNPRKGLNFKQVKQVQKIIQKNQQIKTTRVAIASLANTTGALTELSAITEGDNFNNRDGDKIKAQSLKVCYSISPDTTNAILQIVRIIIVRGKYGPLVLADLPTAIAGQCDLDKMQVYHDRIYQLLDNQDAINDNSTVPFFKSFKNKKVPHLLCNFDDDVSATACQSNPLYFYVLGASASTPCAVNGFSDLKFFNAN